MKKNLILSLLFAAACSFAGFNSAQAQTVKGADVPAMQADVQTMADEVMANQLNDPDEANKTFAKLVKKIKNDKEQLVAVGNFFLEKKIYPCANQCAKQAYTIDPQYVPGLMLQAQVCMLRKDWGGAGQKFDEILNIQPDNIEALRLSARVYKFVNPIVAKEALAKILEREPNNLTAYKELGDIAYTADEFKEASAAYKKYFDGTPNPTIDDVHTGENYVISLMNQSDFTTIKDIAEKLLKLAPSDLVLRRMLFYAQVETMDFEHAKESIAYLDDKQYPDSAFLYRDYIYAASFAADGLDDRAKAIEYYKKAFEKDSTKADGYRRMAVLLRSNKQAVEAIPYYKKYLELIGDKADAAERFGLGNIYIAAQNQTTDPAERQKYIDAGDKIFAEYMEEQPTKYQGPFYRAQLWILNSSQPEEKPREYYAKALELIGNNSDYDSQKKVALRYLAFYYLKKNEDATCMKYVDQLLKLDPKDAFALKLKSVLK